MAPPRRSPPAATGRRAGTAVRKTSRWAQQYAGPLSHPGLRFLNRHQAAKRLGLSKLSRCLAIDLLQSSLLLVSFVGVLWVLSAQVVFSGGSPPQ
jgi:hypothetical protein